MTKIPVKSGKQASVPSSALQEALTPIAAGAEHNGQPASLDDIRLAAYLKWEAAGKPICDGTTFWFEAEQAAKIAH